MPLSWSIFFALQHLFLQCYAYPRFAVRDAHPQITAAPVLGVVSENELLRRQDSCTWPCAVCALYAPCENCVSLSTPVGIECCTSKLADQSACPTANVPPDSTIYIYTLGTLTLFGNPTSLMIGSDTLTPGGSAATTDGHTLSIPKSYPNASTTATGGSLVEDGTTTTLGTPISTVTGTGSGPTSTFCPIQEISDGQVQNVPCSSTNTAIQPTSTNTNIDTGLTTGTATAGTTSGTNTDVNTGIQTANTGLISGTTIAGTNSGTNTNANAATQTANTNTNIDTGVTTGTATAGTTSGTNTNANTGTQNVNTGVISGTTIAGTNLGTNTDTNTNTYINTGVTSGTLTAGTNSGTITGIHVTNTNTGTITGAASTQTDTGTDTGIGAGSSATASTITNTAAPAPSTYTIDGISFTGNPTSLVAGTVTLTPGGPGLTSSGHTIAIPTSASGGQIQVDGTTTSLPAPNTATITGTGIASTTAALAPSTYTVDGITFTGNPTSLVAGTVTLTPGGPGLTSSGHTIAIPTSASGGQIQVDGTTTTLPAPNTAATTGTGTAGTVTGTITGTGK